MEWLVKQNCNSSRPGVYDFFTTAIKTQQPFWIVAFRWIKRSYAVLKMFNQTYLDAYIIQVLVDRILLGVGRKQLVTELRAYL